MIITMTIRILSEPAGKHQSFVLKKRTLLQPEQSQRKNANRLRILSKTRLLRANQKYHSGNRAEAPRKTAYQQTLADFGICGDEHRKKSSVSLYIIYYSITL